MEKETLSDKLVSIGSLPNNKWCSDKNIRKYVRKLKEELCECDYDENDIWCLCRYCEKIKEIFGKDLTTNTPQS